MKIAFPSKLKVVDTFPFMIIFGVLIGLTNMSLVALLSSPEFFSLNPKISSILFISALLVFVFGKLFVESKVIRESVAFSLGLTKELVKKVLSTKYQTFEGLDRGRLYSILSDDINVIGENIRLILNLSSKVIILTLGVVYIFSISILVGFSLLGIILFAVIITNSYSKSASKVEVKRKELQNDFMSYLNAIFDGYKELSLNSRSKKAFQIDVLQNCNEYAYNRQKVSFKFLHNFSIQEFFFYFIPGFIAFILPIFVLNLDATKVFQLIILFLFMLGPITELMHTAPEIVSLKVAWNRIKKLRNDLNLIVTKPAGSLPTVEKNIQSLKIENILFSYGANNTIDDFKIGPISFEANKGDIIFITGGNGSGKTTIAKVITGLYTPDSGSIYIDNKKIESHELCEYYSTVFSDYYLFEKLYGIDVDAKSELIKSYLRYFELDKKVFLNKDKISSIKLSSGQKKRLALILCLLNDSPIILLDEWAADQSPSFKKIFYHNIILELKQMGKIVIAITHDDHYYNVADKIIKLDSGKIENIIYKAGMSLKN